MLDLAYVNGVFCPIAEAKVSIEDRGYQFGDGIYEVVAAYHGRPFLLDRHMARFRNSAKGIRLEYDFDGQPLEPIVMEGLRRCGRRTVAVYMQLTRGVAPRSHMIPAGLKPTVVMTFRPLPQVPEETRRNGSRLMTSRETRWANCYIKAITLLPNILARNEAIQQGFDDALFVSESGAIMECTSSNIFLVQGKTLQLPSRTESILHGVTQGFLLECAGEAGLSVREQHCNLEMLKAADEVFISSTAVEVLGVTSVDQRPVADGRVGPVTKKLHEVYRNRVHSACCEGRVQ